MDLGLAGKICMIAGGSAGIGAAVAKTLAAEGVLVSVAARSKEGLESIKHETMEKTGMQILTIRADLSRQEDCERFVRETAEQYGAVDILINSAGSSMFGRFEQVSDERWVYDLTLKLLSAVRLSRAVLPYMRQRGGGRIVNIAGNSGKQPYMWHFPGGAANAALLNFTHALAQELCEDNILVTAVCPGPVRTRRLNEQIKAMADLWQISLEEAEKRFYEGLPFGRVAEPEEVADLVSFLVSNRASYISGIAITIDGCITKGI